MIMAADDRSLAWVIFAIVGPFMLLPLRNGLLKVRKLVFKQGSLRKGVLRGGRFSSDTVYTKKNKSIFFQILHITIVLPIYILYRLLIYTYRSCSKLVNSTRNVSFLQHSDGSISSQRYYFDRNEAPSVGPRPLDNSQTPLTDKKSSLIHTRVATPIPAKKNRKTGLFGFTPKEQKYDNISKQIGGKENYAPTTRRKDYATICSWPELTTKSLSVESRDKQTNYVSGNSTLVRGTKLVLRKQPTVSKQSSPFSETPMKANFLIPYASSTPSSRLFHHDYQSSLSRTKNGDTRSLEKRAFKLTANSEQSFTPRKRLALPRGGGNSRKSRKPMDPEKRKQRQELLLKEFNRKRPKVEDRNIGAGYAPQLGNKEQTSMAPAGTKSTFQFGSGLQKTDVGSAVNFAPQSTTVASSTTLTATQPKDNSTTTPAPAIADAKPGFAFGASNPVTTVPKEPTDKSEAPKPGFAFGSKVASSQGQTQGKADGNKPSVSFVAVADKPSFGISVNQNPVSSSTSPKVAFALGAAQPAPPAPKPSVSFGGIQQGQSGTVANSQTPTTFAFGGNPSTASTSTAPQFGVPQFNSQQQPAMPSAAARRKAAQRKSRSRRGAA